MHVSGLSIHCILCNNADFDVEQIAKIKAVISSIIYRAQTAALHHGFSFLSCLCRLQYKMDFTVK